MSRLAGYFSLPISQWFSEEKKKKKYITWVAWLLQNAKMYSRHAWESLRSVTFPPLFLTRSWWNSAPWAATSTRGVWTNKAFFVLSCQAEKRDHLRLPGGALRLHIFICLTYSPSLADIHAGSVNTFTHLENNRRRTTATWGKFTRRCLLLIRDLLRRSLPIQSHVLGRVVIR